MYSCSFKVLEILNYLCAESHSVLFRFKCFKCLFRFASAVMESLLFLAIPCGPNIFFTNFLHPIWSWRFLRMFVWYVELGWLDIANCFCDSFFIIAPNYDVACLLWGRKVKYVCTITVKHHWSKHYGMVVCLSGWLPFVFTPILTQKHDPRLKVLSIPMILPPFPMQFMIKKFSFRSNLSVFGK